MVPVTAPSEGIRSGALPSPLGWALSKILPGREETFLLRAILHRGPSAGKAWASFSDRIQDLPSLFRTDTGGRNRLSPLLLHSIRENELPADPGLLTVLRTAYLREQLRSEAYRKIASGVYGALRERQIPFLVLKGAAFSETVYSEPGLRHSHDIDLLLPAGRLDEAGDAVSSVGFQGQRRLPGNGGITLQHYTELPVLLLSRLFHCSFYRSTFGSLWEDRVGVDLPDLGSIDVLRGSDALVNVLGHASYSPRRSTLVWVADAWMLLQRGQGVDWSRVLIRLQEVRAEIPAYVMLRYLARQLDAPIPEEVLANLGNSASKAEGIRLDVALYGARQTRGGHSQLTHLVRPRWTERVHLFLWWLFPSKEYVAWAYNSPPRALIPLIYLARPFTYAFERLKWRVVGLWSRVKGST